MLIEKNNLEIALIVFYIGVDIRILQECGETVNGYKSIKQSYLSKHYFLKENKNSGFLLIHNTVSIK